jgi:hypothetical protein
MSTDMDREARRRSITGEIGLIVSLIVLIDEPTELLGRWDGIRARRGAIGDIDILSTKTGLGLIGAGVCGLDELSDVLSESWSVVSFEVDGERWPWARVAEVSLKLARVDRGALWGWNEMGRGLAGRPGLNNSVWGPFRSDGGDRGVGMEVW